ncbi:MAG: dinitrogenase iron-molybdenum cofactor biosynthesis protein [Methanobacterium sp. BRmetb2]|nr:MAG: dinitrogenase iron-molybdenum cofactor biosynthesis protein [Methanobacterium sp. BRmetb2]
MTTICIPTLQNQGLSSEISMHFGKSPFFTFLKMENNEIKNVETVESRGRHTGGAITPAEIILNHNADVLVCGNLGSKAVNMLKNSGLKVYSGASGTVKEAVEKYLAGELSTADDNSCTEKH